jgi:hypothetical protein
MDLQRDRLISLTRRHFFGRGAAGIGMAALAGLLGGDAHAGFRAYRISLPKRSA